MSSQELADKLAREQRRAMRSNRPLVFVTVNAPSIFAMNSPARQSVLRIIASKTRQTDIVGWLTTNVSIGIVCTEIGQFEAPAAGAAIAQKLEALLAGELSERQLKEVRLSVDTEAQFGRATEEPIVCSQENL